MGTGLLASLYITGWLKYRKEFLFSLKKNLYLRTTELHEKAIKKIIMSLQLVKENAENIWTHRDPDNIQADLQLSSGFFKMDGNTFELYAESGTQLRTAELNELQIIDNTAASAVEVFSNKLDLITRLKVLEYPFFDNASASNPVAEVDKTELMIDINSVGSKAGYYVFGKKAGINDGNLIIGWKVKAAVSNPISDADFDEYGFTK